MSVRIIPFWPRTSALWSYPYGACRGIHTASPYRCECLHAWRTVMAVARDGFTCRHTSIKASLPLANWMSTVAVSKASAPGSASIDESIRHEPLARISTCECMLTWR